MKSVQKISMGITAARQRLLLKDKTQSEAVFLFISETFDKNLLALFSFTEQIPARNIQCLCQIISFLVHEKLTKICTFLASSPDCRKGTFLIAYIMN